MLPAESRTVWKMLRGLAENGDMKAIKLYYDILVKKEQGSLSAGASAADAKMSGRKREPDMMPLAAIRRAVFGDRAMCRDCLRTLEPEAEKNGIAEAEADAVTVTETVRDKETENVRAAETVSGGEVSLRNGTECPAEKYRYGDGDAWEEDGGADG